jgi:hypothetical protein
MTDITIAKILTGIPPSLRCIHTQRTDLNMTTGRELRELRRQQRESTGSPFVFVSGA